MCGNVWGYAQIAVPDLELYVSRFPILVNFGVQKRQLSLRTSSRAFSDWRGRALHKAAAGVGVASFAQRAACQWRPTGHAPRAVLVPNAWVQMCANLCEFGRIWADLGSGACRC